MWCASFLCFVVCPSPRLSHSRWVDSVRIFHIQFSDVNPFRFESIRYWVQCSYHRDAYIDDMNSTKPILVQDQHQLQQLVWHCYILAMMLPDHLASFLMATPGRHFSIIASALYFRSHDFQTHVTCTTSDRIEIDAILYVTWWQPKSSNITVTEYSKGMR